MTAYTITVSSSDPLFSWSPAYPSVGVNTGDTLNFQLNANVGSPTSLTFTPTSPSSIFTPANNSITSFPSGAQTVASGAANTTYTLTYSINPSGSGGTDPMFVTQSGSGTIKVGGSGMEG